MINVKETVHVTDEEQLEISGHEETSDIIDIVTLNTEKKRHVEGIVIGRLKGFSASKHPCVEYPMNVTGRPVPSLSTVELNKNHIGQAVALMFEMNDIRKPIIIGLMHVPYHDADVEIDNEIMVISAEKEIHIRCGESSIHLKKDGKIEIRGKDILSLANRGNKIKGGMVGLN